jgi:hypothetical protein
MPIWNFQQCSKCGRQTWQKYKPDITLETSKWECSICSGNEMTNAIVDSLHSIKKNNFKK